MNERAYYNNSFSGFLPASEEQILGTLASKHHFALDVMQKNAWSEEMTNLKQQLLNFQLGDIFLEFSIPRMGKRVDVLFVIAGVIFLVEYKVGSNRHDRAALDQVMDYALDLKNFHEGSQSKSIVPILVSTKAISRNNCVAWSTDHISDVLLSDGNDLGKITRQVLIDVPVQEPIEVNEWTESGYKPTPTIVEAAQALYRGHSVEEISRSDAGVTNLSYTTKCISEIIDHSKRRRRKSICFVTGVPGAGKNSGGLKHLHSEIKSRRGRVRSIPIWQWSSGYRAEGSVGKR